MNSVPGNGQDRTTFHLLMEIAEKLNDPQDRDAFVKLAQYTGSLPSTDELVIVAGLFGFLTKAGLKLPEAIAAEEVKLRELLFKAYKAFEQEVKTNQTYHKQLNERLSRLPEEIAEGVKPEDIAKVMAESFRQQIAQTGLEDAAEVLKGSLKEIRSVVSNLSLVIHRFEEQSRTVDQSIGSQSRKLQQLIEEHRWESEKLYRFSHENRGGLLTGAGIGVFVIGLVIGLFWRDQSTTATLQGIRQQLDRIEQTTKTPAPVTPPAASKRVRKN